MECTGHSVRKVKAMYYGQSFTAGMRCYVIVGEVGEARIQEKWITESPHLAPLQPWSW
jgi:hypothetical protein